MLPGNNQTGHLFPVPVFELKYAWCSAVSMLVFNVIYPGFWLSEPGGDETKKRPMEAKVLQATLRHPIAYVFRLLTVEKGQSPMFSLPPARQLSILRLGH